VRVVLIWSSSLDRSKKNQFITGKIKLNKKLILNNRIEKQITKKVIQKLKGIKNLIVNDEIKKKIKK